MARWMKPETKAKLKELVEECVPRLAIINRLQITPSQFIYQCKVMNLNIEKTMWGLCKTYRKLQGENKKGLNHTSMKESCNERIKMVEATKPPSTEIDE